MSEADELQAERRFVEGGVLIPAATYYRIEAALSRPADHAGLVEALEALAQRQREQRGDMLYLGCADPEIEQAITALRNPKP